MFDKMSLSRSASFFKKRKAVGKTVVENLFRKVSTEKIGNYATRIVRESKTIDGILFKYSLLIFKFEDEPSFLRGSKCREQKYAFLLLIELSDYLIVFKKHIMGFEKILKAYITRIDYEKIQYLFGDEESSYEKLTSSPMGITNTGISRRTLESKDLRGQISTHTSRRSVPIATTVRSVNGRHVLRPGSSSISKVDSKTDVKAIVRWLDMVCNELSSDLVVNSFFDAFARPVGFEALNVIPLKPIAAVLNSTELKDSLEVGGEILFRGITLDEKKIDKLIDILETTYIVTADENRFFLKLDGNDKPLGELKVNKKSITLKSNWLKELSIRFDDSNEVELINYFNSQQLFSVTFENPEYIYISRKIFQDRGIISNLEEVLTSLITADFTGIDSEKGEIGGKEQNEFSNTSVFRFFEDNLAENGSTVICDDLGDEWADYIELRENSPLIRLVHCKYGSNTTSASNFHEVVGQALKNIGRVSFTSEGIERKLAGWSEPYSNTSINKIRTGEDEETLTSLSKALIKSTTVKREISLITPFLSKNDLNEEFEKIKKYESVRPHIPQLIWLLTSFIASCKDQGITPVIYCSE